MSGWEFVDERCLDFRTVITQQSRVTQKSSFTYCVNLCVLAQPDQDAVYAVGLQFRKCPLLVRRQQHRCRWDSAGAVLQAIERPQR
jgi:hypothetical protein